MRQQNISFAQLGGLILLGSTLLLAVSNTALATSSPCIDNDADLGLALDAAQATATTIRLVQGTYHLDTTVWNSQGPTRPKFQNGSSLLGGYTASCAGRNIAVGNTMLTDATSIEPQIDALGDATFEGITFNLRNGFEITTDGNAAGSEVLIRRNVFTGSSTNDTAALIIEWNEPDSGTLRLVDNLVHDNNDLHPNQELGAVTIFVNVGTPKIELINNTVVNNGGQLEGISIQNSPPVAVYAYNNIFFGNAGLDFVVQTGNKTVLVDNDIGTFFFPAPATPPVGTTRGDPKLDGGFRPIESPPSPVINTGTDNNVPGGLPASDLPGRDREVGSEPDRGAFESTINDSLIQSVTSTADSGVGTLRSAILGANANGPSGALITFNLGPTCGPSVITLQTALPDITQETHILGYSQPGAAVNDLATGDDAEICVVLDGSAHAIADGFTVPAGVADSMKIGVTGIAFSGFSHAAVNLRGGSGHAVSGIHIGGTVNGVDLDPVGYGVIIGPGVHDVTVGGDYQDYGLRNIIGQAINNGINIDGAGASAGPAHDNQIIDNYLGLGYTSATAFNRGNGSSGLSIGGFNNDVERNYFDYNVVDGVHVTGTDAHDNTVEHNYVGYLSGHTDSGNGIGILVDAGAHDNSLSLNLVSNNIGAGTRILSGLHNAISATSFFNNGALGIDLASAGATPNDNDSQGGAIANRGQNFPVLTAAAGGHTKGTINATLTSTLGDYDIDFYASIGCDASGYGQGEYYLGHKSITLSGPIANGQTSLSFSATLQSPLLQFPGVFITATATDSMNDTSEFSACFPYTDDTIFANGFDSGLLVF